MEKFIEQFTDALSKLFKQQWTVLVVCLGGLIIIFAVSLIISLTTGDFIRCKKGCKMITEGELEEGIAKLKWQGPGFNKERYFAFLSDDFSYEKIVAMPYAHSGVRMLKELMFGATLLFFFLSNLLSPIPYAGTAFVMFTVLSTITLGSVLTVASAIISHAVYKCGVKRFATMTEALKDITFTAQESRTQEIEEQKLLPTTVELYEKIAAVANNKENTYETLNELFNGLKTESKKPQSLANGEKLKEAADLLNTLIENHNNS